MPQTALVQADAGAHHIDVVTFVARQLLDGMAPSNFIATNPVGQQVTLQRGGENLLTTGGHNAGVVSPPGMPGRSSQVAVHAQEAPYRSPDAWDAINRRHDGSWWPAWESWLARHAGAQRAQPAPVPGADAPGSYVLVR